jgi:PhnB protein
MEAIMQINPYLHYNGNCEEALKFYAEVLRGKVVAMATFGSSPMAEQTPPEFRQKIMHGRIDIGAQIIMGSDAPPDRFSRPQGFSVSINTDSPAEAERIFAALTQGGSVTMPLQQTFWAQRFGMGMDRFGIPWMVNCQNPQ